MKTKLPKKSIRGKKKTFDRKTFLIIFTLSVIVTGFITPFFFINTKAPCANSISCINGLNGDFDKSKSAGVFMGEVVTSPPQQLAEITPQLAVLGETNEPKRIEVDLSTQHLYAYQGDKKVFDFPVSTGKWWPTPTGTFSIWVKLRYTKMEGGNKSIGTYYNLPNVPYTMFFYNKDVPKSIGYGIHGAYWHNNFGHPMSHGCINMKEEDVALLYYWADPPATTNITYATKELAGTQVVIYGETPKE